MSRSNGGDERPWEYSAFPVTVARVRDVSPNFRRVTISGAAVRHFAPWGLDQRIKLVLPLAGIGFVDVGLTREPTPHPRDWYTRWKSLPEERRNPLRTYTPSAIRPEDGEIDVDVFLHQPAGPASHWARTCRPGDELIVTGPDARCGYTGYGIHFTPPVPPSRLLLVGDESAVPAIRNIVRAQPPEVSIEVLADVADAADLLDDDLRAITTLARPVPAAVTGGVTGGALEGLVREWADAESAAFGGADDGGYVWIAGETAAVARIRRHLTATAGIAPTQISFLGYWKQGGPLVG
ncbi:MULTISPECIES: siderophore-interacting protein [Microbacterium]|uniref:Siderophore-interacting protein n=1 Tax=Microbacterium hominis TaxID=162426 RepID=A0A2K9DLM4_9MICO|nr:MULTISPECIES: siderophore-interacting protein [Microbacterium]AUG29278.1 siderophore-interacting protein [Microbacterium hominis]